MLNVNQGQPAHQVEGERRGSEANEELPLCKDQEVQQRLLL